MTDATVLVVGAGPTGLLLAAELTRRGVACRVIDSHPAPLHWDRATIVHPRSLEVFESLGIVGPLLATGVKQTFARLHSAGAVLGEIDLTICGSRYGFNIGVSEEVTERILTNYLERLGGHVVRSSKLIALDERPGGLIATIERDGVPEKLNIAWVVGCDGLHSTTRTLCGIELAGHEITEPWAVFDVSIANWPHTHDAIFGYLDEPPVILTSLPQNRWRAYLRPTSADSDLVADAMTTLGRYLPGIVFHDITNPTRFHCHTRIATRYRAGRVLLAGDAAHVCSPSQGHGMNSGLQDAFNLAWKLALVCQGHCDAALLDSYEAERRPVAERITASGDAFEQAQDLTDPAERRARDKSLRAIFANPTSRHHESIAEAELDIDYCASPIVMGDPHEALSAGHRLPDTIEVRLADGAKCCLHELTHRAGHTALVIGGANANDDELARLTAEIAATIMIASDSTTSHCAPTAAAPLGVDEMTLLVIRPDGHVGLRADRDHLTALAAYEQRLADGSA